MKPMAKILLASTILTGLSAVGAQAEVAANSRLKTVQDRGTLLCTGHNGSFLGFAEVDDKGVWKGLDVELCKALATGLFGTYEGHLEIVPVSWAQRWPALQSGDVDVIIKASGWTQSRDTELNLTYSMPYFIGAFQVMSHASLGAEKVADLDGGTICVNAGTSVERSISNYADANGLDIEILTYENGDEIRNSYFEGRCDGWVEWAPALATGRVDAPDGADAHVILPEVIELEAEGIIVPEGDADWLDVQNWMLSSLWFAELNGITSANVDEMKANPESPQIATFLGATPGYGTRLGLSDDWAYNMIKHVGNMDEIYSRSMGDTSPYKLARGVNSLYTNGGVFYPLQID
ncbi:transporter substrate-binding domain-containing protein [Donghicola tyrosinivorans]|uniref:General L-amino acid transport system substrate-binding protein n=1 Tax=Donghicola tyrosinivorans TaxID=1652492 RepID=A0A2T0W8P7_9RHOB|nr:transporter substrate-binding domain-containing protein [Donghicola tyrosinivorans]PRY83081.1 general L-amino acid transport system substrate-binding protein [Donghicola tyrosinivorans]